MFNEKQKALRDDLEAYKEKYERLEEKVEEICLLLGIGFTVYGRARYITDKKI